MTGEGIVAKAEGLEIRDALGRALVCDVDFDVRAGKCVGVVGETGSGKTLCARTLLGLAPAGLAVDARTLLLVGRDMRNISLKDRRELLGRHVGFVPQNTSEYLHPQLRVRTQLIDGYLTWHDDVSRREALARARGLLERMGFDDPDAVMHLYPGQLSGGMRQRVNIAMALMGSPDLVVADEPTAALDSVAAASVVELLTSTVHDLGAALLLISHDMGLVRSRCDEVYVMYAGRCVERGPTRHVLANPGHPYTRALVASMPTVGMGHARRLVDVAGSMPETSRDEAGCTFYARCKRADASCVSGLPSWRSCGGTACHECACVHAWEVGHAADRG